MNKKDIENATKVKAINMEVTNMEKYTLTLIKAIANCEIEENIIQEAILVHLNSDEFSDGDCIIFGATYDESWADDDIDDILVNEYCPTYREIREDGVYIANA